MNTNTSKSWENNIENYKLFNSCYQYMRKFSKKYFKNSYDNQKIFPDPTFLPNKLKFSKAYEKSILIQKHSTHPLILSHFINNLSSLKYIHIHIATGRTRLCNTQNKRLRHLILANHSYRIPSKYLKENLLFKSIEPPILLFIKIPIQNNVLNMLSSHTLFDIISPPKFAFIDCEMAWAKVRRKNIMCLTSISIIDENGDTLLNTLTTPSLSVCNYVYRITGLNEKRLRGKMDERTAIHQAHHIFQTHIIVGCGITNDLKVLKLGDIPNHRKFDIGMSQTLFALSDIPQLPMGLKNLSRSLLEEEIQQGHHTSYEDAFIIYRLFCKYKEALTEEYNNDNQ